MEDQAIQIFEYKWKDYIGLIFKFRDFWSNEVKVSKHKRVCYKRIFYATKLWKRTDDRKILSPTRTITEIVNVKRLKEKGCL